MNSQVKVAFASGTDELNRALIERMRAFFPELPLYVVSDFPPEDRELTWIPYRVNRGLVQNWLRCRAAFRGKSIRLAGVLLVPNVPFRRMRLLALALAPLHFLAFNEHLNNFMLLRPQSLPAILRHGAWRSRNLSKWAIAAAADADWNTSFWHAVAWLAGAIRPRWRRPARRNQSSRPGFVAIGNPDPDLYNALAQAFERIPDLFCATTGSLPLPGVDLSYILKPEGGCSLYSAAKLDALGLSPYEHPRLRDLDLGYRAWQRGWPTVEMARSGGQSQSEIPAQDYLRFLARTIADPKVFRGLWTKAIDDLARSDLPRGGAKPAVALRSAAAIALGGGPAITPEFRERWFLALTSGAVAVFPGRTAGERPRIIIGSPYLAFPLSHGGAVRMYNMMRLAALEFDLVLVVFADALPPPPREILDICVEVVLVQRTGSHVLPSTGRPDVVEEFDSPAFHAALRQSVRNWNPIAVQLEFTQMAQYAADCASAATILVEHDITFDLYQQMLLHEENWDIRRQLKLWRRFETDAWRQVDCVVAMSEKDKLLVDQTSGSGRAVALPNGVDLARFQPGVRDPEPRRLLFIGSFAHLPNLIAVEFLLNQVWPLVTQNHDATLEIIAGARHEYFLEHYRDRITLDLTRPGVEVQGFIADVRPSYQRASVVAAPLLVSAGTNIKVLEAMAMGKAVVSTPAGVNGLDLAAGDDFVLVQTAEEMASAILRLFADSAERSRIEANARQRVEHDYGWESIGRRQAELYRQLAQRRLARKDTPGQAGN